MSKFTAIELCCDVYLKSLDSCYLTSSDKHVEKDYLILLYVL